MCPKTRTAIVSLGALAALTSMSFCATNSVAAPDNTTTARPSSVRDGSHDFDFIYGKWRMPNHHLKKRLAGSQEWDDFIAFSKDGGKTWEVNCYNECIRDEHCSTTP